MIFEDALGGARLIEVHRHEDERGYFARTFCEEAFAAAGLPARWPQMNLSHNAHRGTVRGMHFQRAPHEEAKVVRCVRGAIFDVVVDLRPDSATYARWFGVELTSANAKSLYVPAGFAHGFQVLEADSDVLYLMSYRYQPDAAAGLRWDDPSVGIEWPLAATVGERDARLPLLESL